VGELEALRLPVSECPLAGAIDRARHSPSNRPRQPLLAVLSIEVIRMKTLLAALAALATLLPAAARDNGRLVANPQRTSASGSNP